MPVGDVALLSESDGEGPLAPEPPSPVHRRAKRRRLSSQPSPPASSVDPPTALRAILGKPCRCKRRNCLALFATERFDSLLEYRQSFFTLHKLDQDHSAS
jgi:hypothetical protein